MNLNHRDYVLTIDGVTVTLRGTPLYEAPGGAPYFRDDDGMTALRLVALALLRAGSHGPQAFRRTSHALGLKPAAAAELLSVPLATVAAWETGETPVDRATLSTLGCLAVEGGEGRSDTADRLRPLASPAKQPRTVALGAVG